MRVVALEEHFINPAILAQLDGHALPKQNALLGQMQTPWREKLSDLNAGRIGNMDACGITMQVLSLAGIGAEALTGESACCYARAANDDLARKIAERPDRFAGLAHLPVTEPEASSEELERCITELNFRGVMISGTTQGLFLDDPKFSPILAKAEQLGVPLYIHPGLPPEAVMDAYYGGLPGPLGSMLAAGGWGWHSETAIHVLRLVLSGTLDRFPGLQLIVGHMGEMLPVMMGRIDDMFGQMSAPFLKRRVSETILDQVSITTSGIFTLAPFLSALMTFGADRILFSVDYPFSPSERGQTFLEMLPVSPADKAKIAHGNADRLLRLTP